MHRRSFSIHASICVQANDGLVSHRPFPTFAPVPAAKVACTKMRFSRSLSNLFIKFVCFVQFTIIRIIHVALDVIFNLRWSSPEVMQRSCDTHLTYPFDITSLCVQCAWLLLSFFGQHTLCPCIRRMPGAKAPFFHLSFAGNICVKWKSKWFCYGV